MIVANTGFVPANRGHQATGPGRSFCLYTVYDNRTDFPLIIDGTADECAKVLRRSRNSFYCMVDRVRKGKNKRFTVLRRMVDEDDLNEYELEKEPAK